MTGMRRSELLGLRWTDIDLCAGTLSINRSLVAVGYELHELRGKTRNSRRRIDLDPTTTRVLAAWRAWQQVERAAVALPPPDYVFTDTHGGQVHPHAVLSTVVQRSPPRMASASPLACDEAAMRDEP